MNEDRGTPNQASVSPSGAIRHNKGKLRWSLFMWDAAEEVVRVLQWACTEKKPPYPSRNWELGLSWSETFEALQRHSKAWFQDREKRDHESKLLHTGHMAWNALVLCAFELRGIGTDDRPLSNVPPTPGTIGQGPLSTNPPIWVDPRQVGSDEDYASRLKLASTLVDKVSKNMPDGGTVSFPNPNAPIDLRPDTFGVLKLRNVARVLYENENINQISPDVVMNDIRRLVESIRG